MCLAHEAPAGRPRAVPALAEVRAVAVGLGQLLGRAAAGGCQPNDAACLARRPAVPDEAAPCEVGRVRNGRVVDEQASMKRDPLDAQATEHRASVPAPVPAVQALESLRGRLPDL